MIHDILTFLAGFACGALCVLGCIGLVVAVLIAACRDWVSRAL